MKHIKRSVVMNIAKIQKDIDKYFELWERYFNEGNKEKAKECLTKVKDLKNELWKYLTDSIKAL